MSRWMIAAIVLGLAAVDGIGAIDPGMAFDLQARIDAGLKGGQKRIVIEPGRYRVQPRNRQHLQLVGLSDVEIVAQGVELICTETTRAVTIDGCRNVTIRG